MRTLTAVTVGILVFSGVAVAQELRGPPWFSADRCTQKDAEHADENVGRLKDWGAVYRAFKLYGKCDDGSIAEGHSDAVAKLFANRWQSLHDFAKLARAHPLFDRFVFWHLDTTVNLEDGLAIIKNAQSRCPSDLKVLCRRLERAAKDPAGPPK
jgi:hypothetical protein